LLDLARKFIIKTVENFSPPPLQTRGPENYKEFSNGELCNPRHWKIILWLFDVLLNQAKHQAAQNFIIKIKSVSLFLE
jgi:hypothetical protein